MYYLIYQVIYLVCLLLLLCYFFIFFFYDFFSFLLKPYYYFYNELFFNNFYFEKHLNVSLYKVFYSKVYYNSVVNSINFYLNSPDFFLIDNNPLISIISYFFVFSFLILFVCFFLFDRHKFGFLFFYSSVFFLYHNYFIPYKLFQLLNDFINIELFFNVQFTVNYYIHLYFILFGFHFISSIFYFKINCIIYRFLFLFFFTFFLFSFDFINWIYFTINLNYFNFIFYFFCFFSLLEFSYFYCNYYLKKLEMTGIEPV